MGHLDRGYQALKEKYAILEKHGINHVWYEGPDSHEFQVWRHHIHEFATLLFQ